MSREQARKVADAVLREGYALYPYRKSALKNRQLWSFGILYPPDYPEVASGTERAFMHSEFLMETAGKPAIQMELRFLRLGPQSALAEPREQACQRRVETEFQLDERRELSFAFPENLSDIGTDSTRGLTGMISVDVENLADRALRVKVNVANVTPSPPDVTDRDSALLSSMLSTHLLLSAKDGKFVSLMDPPEDLRAAAAACRNVGNFPVLIGDDGARDMLLCSPIILYDYPQIAPESAGDFYDATEMDEMLTLRVMTLSDEEKDEIRRGEGQVRDLLERTEQSAREQLMRTHGVIRSMRPAHEKSE